MGQSIAKGSSSSRRSRRAFERAVARLKAADLSGAEKILRRALQEGLLDTNLYCLLGATLLEQDRPREAEKYLTQSIALAPTFARAYELRASAFIAQQRTRQGLADLQRAQMLAPDSKLILMKLGEAYISVGQKADASKVLLALLSLRPDGVAILLRLAKAFAVLRQWKAAEIALERATTLEPDLFQAWMDLGFVQLQQDQLEAAQESYRNAASLRVMSAAPRVAVATAQVLAGSNQEALASYRQALELEPTNADALAGLGHLLKTIGDQAGAIKAYRTCIANHPGDGQAYWALADFKTINFEDDEITAMESQLDSRELGKADRIGLFFALGTALDRRREFDRAFDCFRQGNELKRSTVKYNLEAETEIYKSLRDVFSSDFLSANADIGDPNDAPIFIVGMPRSGSTLVEQILASHSMVDGTYELPELNQLARSARARSSTDLKWPNNILELSRSDLKNLGNRYLELTQVHRGARPRFTDKMPNNFVHIGLLAIILPNARIINVRRNPLDTCLSCYMQLFANGQAFSYDLKELAGHYIQYCRLMEYWHEVLPGRILDLDYENVIADLDGQVRRLLEYCGLPWEEACVRYHEKQRVIRSASSEQVRRPIYRDAKDRWRNYASNLMPLVEALRPLTGD